MLNIQYENIYQLGCKKNLLQDPNKKHSMYKHHNYIIINLG